MSRPAPFVNPHERRTVLLLCLGLALITWAVFGQTLRFEFVNYDDDTYVYENHTVIDGLTFKGIASAFKPGESDNWIPLTVISHMLDCQIFGLNAGGHHLTNVLLHTAAVILLFLVLWRMTGAIWRNAFVAAVFAIHPLHVESVAWVAERKDVLSGLFFMLTLVAYVHYVRRPGSPPRYLMVLLLFALGLMSKPMLVTLPFVLLLLDYWPLNRFPEVEAGHWLKKFSIPSRLVLEKIPLILLSAASCTLTVLVQNHVDAMSSLKELPASIRIENALFSCVTYVWRSLYPVGLAPNYPYPGQSLPFWSVIGALVLLVAVSSGVFLGRRKYPYLLVGWLFYLGMLVPVIGLVQVGMQASADRYTYLPQIGLSLMVAYGTTGLLAGWRYHRAFLAILAGTAIAVLVFFAHRQASYWKNSKTLWTHTIAVTSNNALAHLNLGVFLYQNGQADDAITEYQKALAINPNYTNDASFYIDLGSALIQKGKLDEAITLFQRAVQINPNNEDAGNNLGNALLQKGKVDEAIAQFQQLLKIDPNNALTHYNLGCALVRNGALDQAMPQFQAAVQIDPDYAPAQDNLGEALIQMGKMDEGILHLRQALKIDPANVYAFNDLGSALLLEGKVDEAILNFQQALKIDPANARTRNNLGNAFLQKGAVDQAISQFQQAVQIDPGQAIIHLNLGNALFHKGVVDQAIAQFQQAVQIDPNYLKAHYYLGIALIQEGKTNEAIVHFQKVLVLARAAGQPDIVNRISAGLKALGAPPSTQ